MDMGKSDTCEIIIIHTQRLTLIYFYIKFYLLFTITPHFVLLPFWITPFFFFPNIIPQCFVIENLTS